MTGPRPGQSIRPAAATSIDAVLAFDAGPQVSLSMSWDVWRHDRLHLEVYGSGGSLQLPDPNWFGGDVRLAEGEGPWRSVPSEPGPSAANRGNARRRWPPRRSRHGSDDAGGKFASFRAVVVATKGAPRLGAMKSSITAGCMGAVSLATTLNLKRPDPDTNGNIEIHPTNGCDGALTVTSAAFMGRGPIVRAVRPPTGRCERARPKGSHVKPQQRQRSG